MTDLTPPAKQPLIAFLGTGAMGAPMAGRLIAAGYQVRVWNRTRSRAEQVAGAVVADTAAQAAGGASVVITMLYDGAAVDAVMRGTSGALAVMDPDGIWIQMSTVGLPWSRRLANLAEQAGVSFLDAPVLGTRGPAEAGKLRILASGPPRVRAQVSPLLAVMGDVVEGLDAAGEGTALKLVANSWVLTLTDATAAAIALAINLGVDPELFLQGIAGTATDSAYAQLKGRAMIDGSFPPSFALGVAAKDAALIAEAGQASGTDTALIDAVHQHLAIAGLQGHDLEDVSAVIIAHRAHNQ